MHGAPVEFLVCLGTPSDRKIDQRHPLMPGRPGDALRSYANHRELRPRIAVLLADGMWRHHSLVPKNKGHDMTNIPVINSSANGRASILRKLVAETVMKLREANPAATVVERDLGSVPLPHLTDANLAGVRDVPQTGIELATRKLSDELIVVLRTVDIVVVGAPRYNFGVSTLLRGCFDYVLRAHEAFAYSNGGPKGLLSGSRDHSRVARRTLWRRTEAEQGFPGTVSPLSVQLHRPHGRELRASREARLRSRGNRECCKRCRGEDRGLANGRIHEMTERSG